MPTRELGFNLQSEDRWAFDLNALNGVIRVNRGVRPASTGLQPPRVITFEDQALPFRDGLYIVEQVFIGLGSGALSLVFGDGFVECSIPRGSGLKEAGLVLGSLLEWPPDEREQAERFWKSRGVDLVYPEKNTEGVRRSGTEMILRLSEGVNLDDSRVHSATLVVRVNTAERVSGPNLSFTLYVDGKVVQPTIERHADQLPAEIVPSILIRGCPGLEIRSFRFLHVPSPVTHIQSFDIE